MEILFTFCDILQGAGTDDKILIEILASRTPEQIKEIIKIYKKGNSFPLQHIICVF